MHFEHGLFADVSPQVTGLEKEERPSASCRVRLGRSPAKRHGLPLSGVGRVFRQVCRRTLTKHLMYTMSEKIRSSAQEEKSQRGKTEQLPCTSTTQRQRLAGAFHSWENIIEISYCHSPLLRWINSSLASNLQRIQSLRK